MIPGLAPPETKRTNRLMVNVPIEQVARLMKFAEAMAVPLESLLRDAIQAYCEKLDPSE